MDVFTPYIHVSGKILYSLEIPSNLNYDNMEGEEVEREGRRKRGGLGGSLSEFVECCG